MSLMLIVALIMRRGSGYWVLEAVGTRYLEHAVSLSSGHFNNDLT